LSALLPRDSPRRLIRPFETLSRSNIDGKFFRFESQKQDVTGHRDFDVQFPEHHLTLTPDGPSTLVSARMDGGPLERFALRPGQLTLLPRGQRAWGYADGLGTRGEMRLSFAPAFITDEGTVARSGRLGSEPPSRYLFVARRGGTPGPGRKGKSWDARGAIGWVTVRERNWRSTEQSRATI